MGDPDAELIFWLHGMAGTGKSSISRTIASLLDKGESFVPNLPLATGTYLGASFFISNYDSSRNKIRTLIPTIAHNLAERIPELGQYIIAAIEGNTEIKGKEVLEQLHTLIYTPATEFAKHTGWSLRLIIIVDALDELNEHPSDVAKFLGLLRRLQELSSVEVKIFLTSRPEPHIMSVLEKSELVRCYSHTKVPRRPLDDANPDDIFRFIKHEMDQITKTRGLSDDWISHDEIGMLVKKSDGLFIYAATICRFLREQLTDEIRKRRVEKIMEGSTQSQAPEQLIGEIYRKVLTFPVVNLSDDEKEVTFCLYRRILGSIALVFEPVSLPSLCALVDREESSLRRDLRCFASIIDIPQERSLPLAFFHESFRDYLLCHERSGPDFWVDKTEWHYTLFQKCISIMNQHLRQDIANLQLPGTLVSEVSEDAITQHISEHLRYSCLYWVDHLNELNAEQQMDELSENGNVCQFLTHDFLHWLEAMSLVGESAKCVLMINHLCTLVDVSCALPNSYCFAN
jgi:hypothetical protein